MRNSNILKYRNVILIVVDILLVFLISVAIFQCQSLLHGFHVSIFDILILQYKLIIFNIVIWLLCALATDSYNLTRFAQYYEVVQKIFKQIIIFTLFYIILGELVHIPVNRTLFILFIFILGIIMSFARILYIFIADKLRETGKNNWNVLFIDENNNTEDFIEYIQRKKNFGLRYTGIFLVNHKTEQEKKIYNFDIENLQHFIRKNNIRMLFVSLRGNLSVEDDEKLKHFFYTKNIPVYYIMSQFNDSYSSMDMVYFNTFPTLSFKSFPLDNKYNQYFKRIFDLVFAFLACVLVLSWVIPLVALAIKLDDGGKVFYIQKRIGFKGRRFNCLKFRTMRPSNENDIKNTQKNDARITRVGRFLRSKSIDEFPQFLNVFYGTMSIIGPRPHMVAEDEYYKKNVRQYYLRHFVPPGITGLAQISGLRGAVEHINDMEKRIAADNFYIRKWSFMLDVFIIFKTFLGLFKKDDKAF